MEQRKEPTPEEVRQILWGPPPSGFPMLIDKIPIVSRSTESVRVPATGGLTDEKRDMA